MSEQQLDAAPDGAVDNSVPVDEASANAEPTEPTEASPAPDEPVVDLGELGTLPISEIKAGYLRHSDYTRKTQALAQERQRLAAAEQLVSALQADPQGTLLELAEALNVDFSTNSVHAEDDSDFDPDDPYMQRISALEQQLKQSQALIERVYEEKAEAALEENLAKAYAYAERAGIEVDEDELLQYAIDNNFYDLKAALVAMHADQLLERQQLGERKKAASVGRGGMRSPTNQPPPRPKTPREAVEMAMRQLGATEADLLRFSDD